MSVFLAVLALAGPAEAKTDYPGCNTRVCVRRVQARAHRRTVRRWVRVARPYAGWLSRLRACESSGDPRAVDSSGTYHGWYQFDVRTWQSVGGRGLPSAAEPAEQSYRAVLLLRRRGTAPWPACGGERLAG